MVSEIASEDVERWVANDSHSATTRNNRLRTLSSAFFFAVKRRWCETNPADRVERATERKPVAGYLRPAQAKALLHTAGTDLRARVAIQLFAGLRPCEMAELNFDNIDLERNQLWVDKEEHTTSHRVVQIMPNLREWLLPYRSRTGKVQPPGFQRRWNDVRRRANLYENWPHDGTATFIWHLAFRQVSGLGKNDDTVGAQ